MQYRHSFHAANFADVHKHIALLALIASMQKKAKGFLYLDTHAGGGLYDLNAADAKRSGEADAGLGRLTGARVGAAIGQYQDALEKLRGRIGRGEQHYPGSPLLAAAQLRESDQAYFVESRAQQARQLQRALDDIGPLACKTQVICGDGYQQIKALMPPPLRRGLVLIDPPYEDPNEERLIAAALEHALLRFETGVYALWYPIKKRHDTDLWLARVTRGLAQPTLALELCVRPTDTAVGLNGSGMLIVNPPWRFDTDAAIWQAQLHSLLGGTGGAETRWLIHES
jgi:23S rRNA (adenine2030-N6)-methyltransferase